MATQAVKSWKHSLLNFYHNFRNNPQSRLSSIQFFASRFRISSLNICQGNVLSGKRPITPKHDLGHFRSLLTIFLHTSQLMPLPLTVSCPSKIQIGFTFLVPAHPGNPRQRAVKWMCVCVCYCSPSAFTSTRTKPLILALFVVHCLSQIKLVLSVNSRAAQVND